jgi:hypothetical protein
MNVVRLQRQVEGRRVPQSLKVKVQQQQQTQQARKTIMMV